MRSANLRRHSTAKPVFYSILVLFISATVFLAACDANSLLTPTPEPGLRVDRDLREYYNTLGGFKVLGPIISEAFLRSDGLKCQYAENALLCFNDAASYLNRVGLAPLGIGKLRRDPPMTEPLEQGNGRVVDGYLVYEKFLPLYDQLYGARTTGKPMTNLRVNNELNRVEQFFENVGFAQNLDDPNSPVYLLPYGAYFCYDECAGYTTPRTEEVFIIMKSNMVDQPFSPSIARMGGLTIWGTPLLQPETKDGIVQQVYTNVIFYSPPGNPGLVQLRPLPLMMGVRETPLVSKVSHPQLVFYEAKDGLGHNVVKDFDRFIALHGGPELSGRPISEVTAYKGSKTVARQCFENYCLLYDAKAKEQMKVRLEPLGEEYLKAFPPPASLVIQNIYSPEHIFLVTAPARPILGPRDEQFVSMIVLQKENGEGFERVEATLVLTLPDQTTRRFYFQPTDQGGMSTLKLPVFDSLKHGDHVSYQVCLNLPSSIPICHSSSYLIWNTK